MAVQMSDGGGSLRYCTGPTQTCSLVVLTVAQQASCPFLMSIFDVPEISQHSTNIHIDTERASEVVCC